MYSVSENHQHLKSSYKVMGAIQVKLKLYRIRVRVQLMEMKLDSKFLAGFQRGINWILFRIVPVIDMKSYFKLSHFFCWANKNVFIPFVRKQRNMYGYTVCTVLYFKIKCWGGRSCAFRMYPCGIIFCMQQDEFTLHLNDVYKKSNIWYWQVG